MAIPGATRAKIKATVGFELVNDQMSYSGFTDYTIGLIEFLLLDEVYNILNRVASEYH